MNSPLSWVFLCQVYTLFGMLFLAFLLVTLVTSAIVIAVTYFQLAVEDYRWCALRALLSGCLVVWFSGGHCI